MRINLTYIISDIGKALAYEWITQEIDKEKFNVSFILINPGDSDLEQYLRKNNIKVDRVNYTSKRQLLTAIRKTYRLLKKNKTTVVHTHLIKANVIGLTAAKLAGVPKRIHTRHHSDYHHVYFPKAVKYDKYVNRKSTHIVSISNVVTKILIEKEDVDEKKITLVHHGFKLSDFENPAKPAVEQLIKKYNPLKKSPVIGVISRYTHWKGIQYIIPAFKKFLHDYPDALLVLANANGDFKPVITDLLKEIPQENYIEIGFEPDIFGLYKLFDAFVHVPVSEDAEAFGQIYIEALAAGIPSVFTRSGIANEFITHEQNALIVKHKDSDEIYTALKRIFDDKALRGSLTDKGKKDVYAMFELKNMISSLEKLYER